MTEPAISLPGQTHIHSLTSILDLIDLTALFPRRQILEVELGSGDGSFLAQYAQLQPKVNVIGVERLLGRLRKTDRKCRRAGIENARLVRIEAAYFLEYLLPPGSVSAIHVYFPDPWPKRKHRRHRLVNERFVVASFRALAAGGAVYLRTDDADYFAQIEGVFAAHSRFERIETPKELLEVRTDFERTFLERGIETRRAAYRSL